MRKQTLVIFVLLFALEACSGKPDEAIVEYTNGTVKALVRYQEFRHSGIRNVDVCVADTSSREFPNDKIHCFLRGYDFSQLSVSWISDVLIEISFDCGVVLSYQNIAILDSGPNRVGIHAKLVDSCERK
jgi:hypothetical protein